MARKAQRARPALENLEARMLLSGKGREPDALFTQRAPLIAANRAAGISLEDRRKTFATPEGGRVVISLIGLGTLDGTSQDPDGALNVVFDNTNADSQIFGRVVGGNGRVPLRTIRDADVPFESLSGIGANQIGTIWFNQFDLVAGGAINLAGGVRTLQLNSIGPATLLDLRSLPVQPDARDQIPAGAPQETLNFVIGPNGTELTGVGGLTVPGAIDSPAAVGSNGAAFEQRITATGQVELIPIGGAPTAGVRIPPPGVNLLVDRIEAFTTGVALGDPQIFGYDPTDNALIRFNARTGAPLQSIPLGTPAPAAGDAGVSLGRVEGRQVVLVGIDQTVQAFDVVTGRFEGAFSTANLVTLPDGLSFTSITGMGTTDEGTFLVDGPSQLVVAIDVAQSIASGVAVLTEDPFTVSPGFEISGGATGVAGLATAFLTGAATFDSFQPLTPLFGVLSVSTIEDQIRQISRIRVSSPSDIVDQVPPNSPPFAFGSIDQLPALVTSVTTADPNNPTAPFGNVLSLYAPTDLAPAGSLVLAHPNRLTGLSESVHPETIGAAVINVRGTLNQITARSIQGAVVNTAGFLAQVRAGRTVDSAFVGLPIGHVDIGVRENTSIVTSGNRPVGKRGGVFVIPGLRPVGPLTPPVIQPVFEPPDATATVATRRPRG